MRTIRKLRYYCDYCKKSGGSPYHMRNHEQHCTLNPNRHCRVCDATSLRDDLEEYVQTLEINEHEQVAHVSEDKDTEILNNLRDKSEYCPACVLSVLRRSKIFFNGFDYKTEMASHWATVNAERREMVAYDHDY